MYMVCRNLFGYGSSLLRESTLLRRLLLKNIIVSSSTVNGNPEMNRLADEKSPYLLQHARNPVNWYPWGQEAFQKAKSEDKMIFLSVGYSTCHWCHVMERESFENENIASLLNEHFVSIKVDREERPDVDKVYMTFVQATSGQGGWPMSVWLTPDLKPLVGGTYFPPDERYFGRPGFKSILLQISKQWQAKKEALSQQGTLLLDAIMEGTSVTDSGVDDFPGQEAIGKCFDMMEKSYDPQYGGFGKAPKFPQPVNFNFLFCLYAMQPTTDMGKQALDMCLHTLTMMAKGGMHDHIAKGFHRYSTDETWHVPHFEKMLYDQGQLAVSYLDAYQITKHGAFAQTARDIFEYVTRDLSHPTGGFYSAEDADSLPTEASTEKKEGAFCVWEYAEIKSLLSGNIGSDSSKKLSDVFCQHFCVYEAGNVDPLQDPHDELKKKNVLIINGGVEKTAEILELSVSETESALEKCYQLLYEERLKRPRPHLDNKMITSWNGLMISAFSKGGQVLGEEKYTQRARQAALFIKQNMYIREEHVLLRSCYTGLDKELTQISSPIHGFLDDYAFLIRGLVDLYESTFDEEWLEWAEKLQEKQNEKFWDSEGGGFYTSGSDDSSIVIRLKDDQDGAEPSANSVSAMNLLRLGRLLQRTEWEDMASRIMKVFSARITTIPMALPEMISALIFQRSAFKQVIIAGEENHAETREFMKCVHDVFMPNKLLYQTCGNKDCYLHKKVPLLDNMVRIDGKTTAYVCENFTCSLPVTSIEDLKKLLKNDTES